jgi:asparagine synthase (glutamine-hydrolysing)
LKKAARLFSLHPACRYAEVFGYLDGERCAALLEPGLRRRASERPEFALVCDLYDRAAPADYLSRMQSIDHQRSLPDDILVKTDRMSMLNSLEVRVPFLDHRLLEYAALIPSRWRLGKRILKKAVGGLRPAEQAGRPKMGFGVPLKHWFRGDWREYARELLLGKRARERGLLDPRAVNALVEDHLGGRGHTTPSLFALLMFEEWCRQYLDQPQRAR